MKLNDSKTEVVVFGSAQQLKEINWQALRVGDCLVRVTHSVCNRGVQFDADMTMESDVTAVCKSAILQFNILLLTHRTLTGHAHGYNDQCVSRRQPVRSLCSNEHNLLCVPCTRRQCGDRAFSEAAPSMWNALPQHLTLTMTTAAFKNETKDLYIFKNFLYSAVSNECWNSAIQISQL